MAQEIIDLTDEVIMMIETMEQIKNKNLIWLKDNEKKLYKKVIKQSDKIEQDKSKEKFALELDPKGNLNMINRKNNKFFYKGNIFDFGDEIANKSLKLKKVIFNGIGLGTHITSYIKQYKPKKVLLLEKDMQIFNCSLYITDYVELSQISKIKFDIGDKVKYTKDSDAIRLKDFLE